MRFQDLLATALSSLRQRLFRTSLTVLGVVIGTMAVVVMMSLGIGLSAGMTAQYDNDTLRRVTVQGVPERNEPGVKPLRMDGSAITALEQYAGVEVVYPMYNQDAMVKVGRHEGWVYISAVPNDALQRMNVTFAEGEFPTPGAPLALVYGSRVNYNFWDEAIQDSPEIDWMNSLVMLTFQDGMTGMPIGEEEPTGENPNVGTGKQLTMPTAGVLYSPEDSWSEHDWAIYADLDALIKTLQTTFPGVKLPGQDSPAASPARGDFLFHQFQVMTNSPSEAEELMLALSEEGWSAYSEVEWIRQMEQQALIVQAVLGGIGFISLLVAAIGIANTMLMSVYERTKEIGIMKVLGASLADIRKLFLFESAAIGFFGGALGVLFSFGVSRLLNTILGPSMGMGMGGEETMDISVITIPLVIAAVLGASLIGMISGFMPAQRATRLSPLDAIRSQ